MENRADTISETTKNTSLSRRDVMFMGAASVAALSARGDARSTATGSRGRAVPDIVRWTATELSNNIRTRQLSCKEVMAAHLDWIDQINPKVNAIVSRVDRSALLSSAEAADRQLAAGNYRGWMHGFPHAVKDLASTRDIRTTFGSPIFADHVPRVRTR